MTTTMHAPATPATLKRQISAWIRHAVAVKPRTMAKVAKAEFGDFGVWVQKLEDGRFCGCLIGATALELCRKEERQHLAEDAALFSYPYSVDIVSEHINTTYDSDRTGNVGMAVYYLAKMLGQPDTETWIRATINRALARQKAKEAK